MLVPMERQGHAIRHVVVMTVIERQVQGGDEHCKPRAQERGGSRAGKESPERHVRIMPRPGGRYAR